MKIKNSLVVLQYRSHGVTVNGNSGMSGEVTMESLEKTKEAWHRMLQHVITGNVPITNITIINVIPLDD